MLIYGKQADKDPSSAEAIIAFEELQDTAKRIRPYADKILSVLNEIEEGKEYVENPNGWTDHDVMEEARALHRAFIGLRGYNFLIYYNLNPDHSICDFPLQDPVSIEELYDENFPAEPVKVHVSKTEIIVKMPLLVSRNNYRKDGGVYPIYRSEIPWFYSEILDAFDPVMDKIPRWPRRHFTYAYVVDESKSRHCDNDSYDTKYITDAVVLCTGGTDEAFSTTFSSMSFTSESLPVGTYLIVTPTYGRPPNLDIVKKNLETIYERRKAKNG